MQNNSTAAATQQRVYNITTDYVLLLDFFFISIVIIILFVSILRQPVLRYYGEYLPNNNIRDFLKKNLYIFIAGKLPSIDMMLYCILYITR